jgi:formamidopyrimidine-DNA glycosylase
VLTLTQDTLLIHLRMSGDLIVLNDPSIALPTHARLVIHFNDGIRLVFNDPRKFGRVWLTDTLETVTGKLGPEPLDAALTPQAFHTRITNNHRQLKPLLLDQRFLAGIGNIYCDEALHLARLHPLRISDSLSLEESAHLLHAIRMVLTQGIEQNGASIDWVYRGGDFQNHFRAYGRSGEPCLVCGTIMEHLRVGQRSTHICPNCQPINGG